jgi:hypothetical protein
MLTLRMLLPTLAVVLGCAAGREPVPTPPQTAPSATRAAAPRPHAATSESPTAQRSSVDASLGICDEYLQVYERSFAEMLSAASLSPEERSVMQEGLRLNRAAIQFGMSNDALRPETERHCAEWLDEATRRKQAAGK